MAKRKSSAKSASSSSKKQKTANRRKETSKKEVEVVEEEVFLDVEDEGGDGVDEMGAMGATMNTVAPSYSDSAVKSIPEKRKRSINLKKVKVDDGPDAKFIGDPIPVDEAKKQWPHRYNTKEKEHVEAEGKGNKAPELVIPARRHYSKALVDGKHIFDLYDDAYVQSGDGEPEYICQIVEMFEDTDGNAYFTARWFYRSVDTDIKLAYLLDGKRVFFSEILDDNPLDCLIKKLSILRLPLEEGGNAKMGELPTCDYYCDMQYLIPYSTFIPLPSDLVGQASDSISTVSTDVDAAVNSDCDEVSHTSVNQKTEATLLDLYSGCGAMSTGLCLGANLSGLKLVTKWAVDFNKFACESLKLNHPETEVRNATVEDFLALLKEWEKLCIRFSLIGCDDPQKKLAYPFDLEDEEDDDDDDDEDIVDDSEVFEVEEILEICYGDVIGNEKRERGLYFKVSWKNYDSSYDTWEPLENLGNCREAIKDFVSQGYNSNILPLPGHVDVICGGPPCQGISGFNRFRNKNNPLADEKNKQLIVFMDVVKHLKPKFVLMENVVDLLKFAGGALGRYGLGRLIEMNYQARIGMMAAGAYGLPQYRMRVFLWGACASEQLPQYPYPTHNVNVRGVVPLEFERNVVAYSDGFTVALEDKLFLKDAISDLPKVDNFESRDEMPYGGSPKNDFQSFIRSRKNGSMVLYDHRPLKLNTDDYQRVCHIPKRKGANFRDLPGVILIDNKSALDPNMDRIYLPSNKPLVPDYAITFVKGTSSKPFARLWWDETVPTVVTRAEPHNQAITHPTQDRVLTIRENARLQGFPDHYKLLGPVKERYIQVGNAVAVPVARALGYALGMAFKKNVGDGYLFTLPPKFPNIEKDPSPASSHEDAS